jgi:hypothetical protein
MRRKVQLRADKTPYVVIDRDPALAEARSELPILAEEYRLLELLTHARHCGGVRRDRQWQDDAGAAVFARGRLRV